MQINISMIQLQKDPPKISLLKSNDLFIVTCFHGYPEVCVWSSASLDLVNFSCFIKKVFYGFANIFLLRLFIQFNLNNITHHQLEVLDSDLYDGHSLSDDLMQWENYICLHGNSLLTIKWVISSYC